MMNAPNIIAAMAPIINAFEQLGVSYYIGGSVASTVYGIPRTTLDADIIAELRLIDVYLPKVRPFYDAGPLA